jgi:hypothetical protein
MFYYMQEELVNHSHQDPIWPQLPQKSIARGRENKKKQLNTRISTPSVCDQAVYAHELTVPLPLPSTA